jgi:hypothetical protein
MLELVPAVDANAFSPVSFATARLLNPQFSNFKSHPEFDSLPRTLRGGTIVSSWRDPFDAFTDNKPA